MILKKKFHIKKVTITVKFYNVKPYNLGFNIYNLFNKKIIKDI